MILANTFGSMLIAKLRLPIYILSVLIAATSLLPLSGCASANASYYGIDLSQTAEALSPEQMEIRELARQARAGSKQAQLDLGIRFEEGNGVPADIKAAVALYAEASKDTQLKQTTYVPDSGGVRPETTYVGVEKGLDEAKSRIQRARREEGGGERGRLMSNRSFSKPLRARRLAFTGASARAIKQLIKIEYFSDLCLNRVFEDDIRKGLLINDTKSYYIGEELISERLEGDERFFAISNRCFEVVELPTDCTLLQEPLLKLMIASFEDSRFFGLKHSLSKYEKCISKGWVQKNWARINSHKSGTPLDYVLYKKIDPEFPGLISTNKNFVQNGTGDLLTFSPAHQYFTRRCKFSDLLFNSEEMDLVLCKAYKENVSNSAVRLRGFLRDIEVTNGR